MKSIKNSVDSHYLDHRIYESRNFQTIPMTNNDNVNLKLNFYSTFKLSFTQI